LRAAAAALPDASKSRPGSLCAPRHPLLPDGGSGPASTKRIPWSGHQLEPLRRVPAVARRRRVRTSPACPAGLNERAPAVRDRKGRQAPFDFVRRKRRFARTEIFNKACYGRNMGITGP